MINLVFNKLSPEQQRCLRTAFEEGTTYIIEYSAGKYIGVNVPQTDDFESQEEANRWSVGLIHKSRKL